MNSGVAHVLNAALPIVAYVQHLLKRILSGHNVGYLVTYVVSLIVLFFACS
jgi:hypothetical protein